jgi:HSP20 family protein
VLRSYAIRLALPGVDPKNVKITLTDNILTVKGERKIDHETAGKEYFVREVAYGTFQRDFALPEGVDAGKIKAKYAHGMLEVSVPKPRVATPTTIEIKAA